MAYIDTHKIFNELTNAGFSNIQAELLSSKFLSLGNGELAKEQAEIKSDIKVMQADIANIKENMANMVTKAEFKAEMTAVKADIANIKENMATKADIANIKADIANMQSSMMKWMITFFAGNIAAIITVLSFLK